MKLNNKKKIINNLWLYKSFLFRFVKFETDIKDNEIKKIIEALNIKSRYKRIYFVIDNLCDQIDDYYKNKNLCKFKNNKCICHRNNNKDYINGCCRKCKYQSSNGCTTKNFACKMFYCSCASKNHKILEYKDLPLLKVLTPLQRMDLKSDYFSSIDEVALDLFWGPLYSIPRVSIQTIKLFLGKHKLTKK